jgi:hypothetical protein
VDSNDEDDLISYSPQLSLQTMENKVATLHEGGNNRMAAAYDGNEFANGFDLRTNGASRSKKPVNHLKMTNKLDV